MCGKIFNQGARTVLDIAASCFVHFPIKRLATLWRPEAFPIFSSRYNKAAVLLSWSGTSSKINSSVALTHFMTTRRTTRCPSKRRMWPSQFQRLSLAPIEISIVGSLASSAIFRPVILDSDWQCRRHRLEMESLKNSTSKAIETFFLMWLGTRGKRWTPSS